MTTSQFAVLDQVQRHNPLIIDLPWLTISTFLNSEKAIALALKTAKKCPKESCYLTILVLSQGQGRVVRGNFFESSYDGGRGNFSDVSIEGRGNYSYSGHAFWSRGCSNSRRSIFSSFLSAKGRKTGASTSCRQRSHLLGGSGSWHPPKRSRRLRIWG